MELEPVGDENIVLVHWAYSREEWRAFVRWKQKRTGILHYVLCRLLPGYEPKSPEIRITHKKIWFNEQPVNFNDQERQLKRVNIKDAGNMNIMEITYEGRGGATEIRVPVPKGKLREAITLQERLTGK